MATNFFISSSDRHWIWMAAADEECGRGHSGRILRLLQSRRLLLERPFRRWNAAASTEDARRYDLQRRNKLKKLGTSGLFIWIELSISYPILFRNY
jgi:hypothetical protein